MLNSDGAGASIADEQGRALLLANVFLFLLVSYGIKFAEILPFDIVLIAWGVLIALFCYVVGRESQWLLVVFYSCLFFVYLLGEAYVVGYGKNAGFEKNIITHFVLSSLLLYSISNAGGRSIGGRFRSFLTVGVWLGFLIIISWVVVIYLGSQSSGAILATEYGGSNYLTTSDFAACFALVVIGARLLPGIWLVLFSIVVLAALVFLGSRASMVVFVVSVLLFSADGLSLRKRLMVLTAATVIVSMLIVFALENLDWSLVYRLETLGEMSGDESKRARLVFYDFFFWKLSNNIGCYIYPCMPENGEYVHNLLSVPEYFGIVGFVLLLALFIGFVLALFNGYQPKLKGLFLYAILLGVSARAWIAFTFPILVAYFVHGTLYYLKVSRGR